MNPQKPSFDTFKSLLSENSKRALLINLGVVSLSFFLIILLFFRVYLPNATNHGELITVPNLDRMTVEEVESFLADQDLRFEVSDSTYNDQYPALAVVSQYPEAGAKVKIDRKIYLTLNRENPPTVMLPNLYDGSLKNAEMIINNLGLRKGEDRYVDDYALNVVLKIFVDGREIPRTAFEGKTGVEVAKGQMIELEVGNGVGNSQMLVPDLVGMPIEEAEQYLMGINLLTGAIHYVDTTGVELGTVIRQYPKRESGATIRQGDVVELWVSGFYPGGDNN